jgi:hypothetical protein
MTNRIWLILAILAAVFPFAALVYELSIDDRPAALLTIGISIVFAVVVILALRASPSRSTDAGTQRDTPPALKSQGSEGSPRVAEPGKTAGTGRGAPSKPQASDPASRRKT